MSAGLLIFVRDADGGIGLNVLNGVTIGAGFAAAAVVLSGPLTTKRVVATEALLVVAALPALLLTLVGLLFVPSMVLVALGGSSRQRVGAGSTPAPGG